ncbi:MAG: PEP-CTERM sorting domain-containing protein [Burkholderiaceae bacterium]
MDTTDKGSLPRSIGAVARLALGALAFATCASASAAFITTNEAGLDAIFSQSGFGTQTLDARFNASRSLVATNLLSIDSDPEFDSLSTFSVYSPGQTINLFFVDAITFCNVVGSFIGCAGGNVAVVSSSFAARADLGANLNAHEIGHNLGLDHMSGSATNLMNPAISSNSSLTSDQIAEILGSGLVQTDGTGQRFLSITPIVVLAAVPEPETWAMLLMGLLGMAGWTRRRRTSS